MPQDILPECNYFFYKNRVPCQLHVLHHDHGIGAFRENSPGWDIHTLPDTCPQGSCRSRSHRNPAGAAEHCRQGLSRTDSIRCMDRIPVNNGPVEPRDIGVGPHRVCEYPAGSLAERDSLPLRGRGDLPGSLNRRGD